MRPLLGFNPVEGLNRGFMSVLKGMTDRVSGFIVIGGRQIRHKDFIAVRKGV